MAATTSRAKSGGSRSSGRSRTTSRSRVSRSSSQGSAANESTQTSRGRSGSSQRASTGANGGSHLSGASLVNSLPHISAPSMPSMPHVNGTVKTVGNVVLPITTAAAGVAGGIVLARTKLQHRRRLLGVPLPGSRRVDLSDLSKQVGEAGRQFGNLASEVRAAREKAEQISKAIGS
jgi:hypothetical protein